MSTLSELLHTDDEQKQVEAVKKLLQVVNAPIITMTAVIDSGTGKTDILLNGRYTYDEIYDILDTVRREVNAREREAILAQKKKE